jgi:hypothetical protein
MMQCIGEPISWLRLERYGLALVSATEQRSIASHLGECAACRACFERIEHGADALRLPLPAAVSRARRAWPTWRNLGSWGLVASGALAALVLLARRPSSEPSAYAPPNVKGGELTLELVRMGADGQQREPSHFSADDRWKARLSCPPGFEGQVDLVVYQDVQVFFPLAAQAVERCGNGITLQGAFRMDGQSPVTVCVVLVERGSVDRALLARGVAGLPARHVCRGVVAGP